MKTQYVISKKDGPKVGRGRKKSTGITPNRSVRFPAELWEDIDEWQRRRKGAPIVTRAEAVRQLLDIALQVEGVRLLEEKTAASMRACLRGRKNE